LDFSKTEYDEKAKGKLFDSVVICNNLDNSKYKQILVSLPFIYADQYFEAGSFFPTLNA